MAVFNFHGKIIEQSLLETIPKHMKDQKVLGSSQYGAPKGKPYPTSLISFWREMDASADEGQQQLFILTLARPSMHTHSILIAKLVT